MDHDVIRESKGIVEDALEDLTKVPVQPGKAGDSQYFLIISVLTKFKVHVERAPHPTLDFDDILLAIYDFLDTQTGLEDNNIYLTKLKDDSILIEPFGGAVFAEVFRGNVGRSQYRDFHRAVKHVQMAFPSIDVWDGSAGALPGGFRESLAACFSQPATAAHAEPEPAGRAAPPLSSPGAPATGLQGRPEHVSISAPPGHRPAKPRPEPDIQDCERKMREWYKKGLKIDRLKDALHKDWATLIRTFDEYERDMARLERLRAGLEGMRDLGFDEELRRLTATLNDPSAIRETESKVAALVKRIKDKYTIRLPVTDPRQIAEAVRSLPLGIPSSLWGIPLDTLISEYLMAEKGTTPDGSVVVWLRGAWYVADPASPEFLNAFSGLVRTQKEMLPPGAKLDFQDEHIDPPLKGK